MLNENGSSSGVVFVERDIESGVFLLALGIWVDLQKVVV